jgi:hypothetical protein
MSGMIHRRRRSRLSMPSGFFRFESKTQTVSGYGDGDFVRLRDEFGNEWRGQAERQADDTIRFRFRDAEGNVICGISDAYGVVLRDEHGNTWRGFID